MTEFLREINWSPLWISLKTGLAATVIAFFLGIFCARKIMKLKPGARAVLDGILTLPLVLPPTVAGFFLLLIFSLKRPFGSFLLDNFVDPLQTSAVHQFSNFLSHHCLLLSLNVKFLFYFPLLPKAKLSPDTWLQPD